MWRQAQAGLGWAAVAHGLHDREADLVAAGTIARRASSRTPHLHLGVHARDQNQRCVGPVGQSDKAVPSGERGHAPSSRKASVQHSWLAAAAPHCCSLAGACSCKSMDSRHTIAAAVAAIMLQHVVSAHLYILKALGQPGIIIGFSSN